jgi:hypothetical protein
MKKYSLKLIIVITFILLVSEFKAQTNIVMNEIYSRGTTTDPDWIEIFNLSSSELDISGYKIYDEGGLIGTKPKKIFLSGSIIPVNGFLVVVTDDTSSSGFGLSSSGEVVWIENTSGVLIDSVVFPALQVSESYSRIPDGQTWVTTNSITRGTSNVYSNPATVVINEIYSRGTASDPDWIELYNPSSIDINLIGYKIYDENGQLGSIPKKEFPSGSIIPANGFFVIVTADGSASGFGLSSMGEEVWLENETGVIIDDVTFPALDITQSYCRYPDGTSGWQLSNSISRGFSNTITNVEDEFNPDPEYRLNQNYPNPFNPTTTISYSIPMTSNVSLKIFNVVGREVASLVNESKSAGSYSINFNASGLSSGVYFYQLTTANFTATKKFILVK